MGPEGDQIPEIVKLKLLDMHSFSPKRNDLKFLFDLQTTPFLFRDTVVDPEAFFDPVDSAIVVPNGSEESTKLKVPACSLEFLCWSTKRLHMVCLYVCM